MSRGDLYRCGQWLGGSLADAKTPEVMAAQSLKLRARGAGGRRGRKSQRRISREEGQNASIMDYDANPLNRQKELPSQGKKTRSGPGCVCVDQDGMWMYRSKKSDYD